MLVVHGYSHDIYKLYLVVLQLGFPTPELSNERIPLKAAKLPTSKGLLQCTRTRLVQFVSLLSSSFHTS
jgi:hypothetical protein